MTPFDQATHVTHVASHVTPAGGAIKAGFVFTVVYLTLAVAACVIRRTFAVVCVPCVNTVATMITEIIRLKTCNIRILALNDNTMLKKQQPVWVWCTISYTSLQSCHLTRNSWDVTVASRPASHTVAGEQAILGSAPATILAWVWAPTPVYVHLHSKHQNIFYR